MDEVQHVPRGAAQAVQLDHDQLVPGVEEVHDPGQLVPPVPALAAGLLGADDLCTLPPEAVLPARRSLGRWTRRGRSRSEPWRGDPVTLGSTRPSSRTKSPKSTLMGRPKRNSLASP